MDYFSIHHKILAICEDLIDVKRRIEALTPEETALAVNLLERLKTDMEDKQLSSSK